jgi:hypothetical protein
VRDITSHAYCSEKKSCWNATGVGIRNGMVLPFSISYHIRMVLICMVQYDMVPWSYHGKSGTKSGASK